MAVRGLDAKTSADLVRLLIFLIITGLAAAMLAIVIGNLNFGSTRSYQAIFTDATGVVQGDDVRISGVRVGSVRGVEVVDRDKALVKFSVESDVPVSQSATATIRYRNLIGQRYISLGQGVGDTAPLAEDATIPLSRTKPALDLTVLFNGFKPLFTALSPADVNKLSYELLQVFQGEGSNIEALLASTASVTRTLADRDQLIGDVITNLNAVLETIGDRDRQLNRLIVELRNFMSGLVQDREAILGSLDSISTLTTETADLTGQIRPGLVGSIKGLKDTAANLYEGRQELDRVLQVLPIKLTKVGRAASYGSWLNFYMCEFQATVVLPIVGEQHVQYHTGTERCDPTS